MTQNPPCNTLRPDPRIIHHDVYHEIDCNQSTREKTQSSFVEKSLFTKNTSGNNRESWSRKSDCLTFGKLKDDMLSHTRRKNSLDSQSAFCTHSAVYILYPIYILYPVCSLHFVLTGIRDTNTVYFWLQLFAQYIQSTTKYLCVN